MLHSRCPVPLVSSPRLSRFTGPTRPPRCTANSNCAGLSSPTRRCASCPRNRCTTRSTGCGTSPQTRSVCAHVINFRKTWLKDALYRIRDRCLMNPFSLLYFKKTSKLRLRIWQIKSRTHIMRRHMAINLNNLLIKLKLY